MRGNVLLALCLVGCTSSDETHKSQIVSHSDDAGVIDAGADSKPAHESPDYLQQCAKTRGDLPTINDAVVRINALPTPVDGPCFVATLQRPLFIVATTGKMSAQPAGSIDSPRLFFLMPKLVVSAVPSGDGSKLLEFGQWVSNNRTIKAEMSLPVTSPLPSDEPYRRIMQKNGSTVCSLCHRAEEPHPSIAGAFVSDAFRPELGTNVTVSELSKMHDLCSRARDTSDRCAMLHAVFDFGEVQDGAFAPEVTTFSQ